MVITYEVSVYDLHCQTWRHCFRGAFDFGIFKVWFIFLFPVPSRNPRIYERKATDFSTLWIRWEKLEESARGGTLLGYRVHVEENYHGGYRPINLFFKVVTVGPDEFEYNITGLPQWTEFQVWVTAYTAAGEGIQQNKEWMRTSKSLFSTWMLQKQKQIKLVKNSKIFCQVIFYIVLDSDTGCSWRFMVPTRCALGHTTL